MELQLQTLFAFWRSVNQMTFRARTPVVVLDVAVAVAVVVLLIQNTYRCFTLC